ncbi:hypothetical protein PFISCL1PPCAC_733, partial [Pristionchus fissidentatus]
ERLTRMKRTPDSSQRRTGHEQFRDLFKNGGAAAREQEPSSNNQSSTKISARPPPSPFKSGGSKKVISKSKERKVGSSVKSIKSSKTKNKVSPRKQATKKIEKPPQPISNVTTEPVTENVITPPPVNRFSRRRSQPRTPKTPKTPVTPPSNTRKKQSTTPFKLNGQEAQEKTKMCHTVFENEGGTTG